MSKISRPIWRGRWPSCEQIGYVKFTGIWELEMKTIGLIGGMSWESTIEYYRIINETVRDRLGGLHSAKSIMVSVDFAEIEVLQHEGRWDETARVLIAAAQGIEKGGGAFVVLCTNTMHKVAQEVQDHTHIPLLHIADATAERVKSQGLKRVGLLGTKFTMEEAFYKGRLIDMHGLAVTIPLPDEREIVHRVIYDELCLGETKDASKEAYIEIIEHLVERGAEGIILGCTEISLLVGQEDSSVPLFDTTQIHAEAAVEYAIMS
jgi:aspartate racemase